MFRRINNVCGYEPSFANTGCAMERKASRRHSVWRLAFRKSRRWWDGGRPGQLGVGFVGLCGHGECEVRIIAA